MSERFNDLQVSEVRRETADCVSVVLEVPEALKAAYAFKQGQYLTFDQEINGESVRRSYSICAGVGEELRVAIKQVPEGRFSTWANESLKAGDSLKTMAPNGRFFTALDAGQSKHYVAFAAGSGITPILSHIKTVLATEAGSTFTLLYTNKDQSSVIFKSELDDLKDRYLDRLRLFHFFTREPVDVPLYAGRMDADKVSAVQSALLAGTPVDEVFACGPEPMIHAVRDGMAAAGVAEENIHFELFTSPTSKPAAASAAPTVATDTAKSGAQEVFVVIDGSTHKLDYDGTKTILDAGLDAGIDLPYSCCGGVCCTCRALVTEGAGEMEVNYALESGEVEQGFVLACQTKPKSGSARFVLDFDQQ
ncbi:2Fe-2S iron-sulfur cluster-binding protein [Flavobacteriales bacterium]|nr:2Fe-2S iron-sulfur cluster-binding protein [Flavobacteriales bacterium]